MAEMGDMKSRSLGRKNKKGLALSAPPVRAPAPSSQDAQIPGAIGNSLNDPGTLEIGVEFRIDLRSEDLVVLRELGAGNGGTVSKVMHAATKVVMARKIIHVEAKKEVRKQIVRELHIMHDCQSPNIVNFYGAFLHNSGDVIMCMEYMDCGSLDRISKDFGPVRVDVLGKIAEAVLNGLNYLYESHRIMHRDIKPSNVLVNHNGNIKLCDFGVSGELVNSIADTFVGTSTYMAPERIQGAKYSIKSDVWSVGLMLMELAIGKFPFDNSDPAGGDKDEVAPVGGILDLLQQIVLEPAPRLPESDAFPPYLHDMIGKCLLKNPDDRPTPRQLYDKDTFLQAAKRTPVDLAEWAVSMLEKHNRKSHLAPQLSPATQALLKGSSPSFPTTASADPNAPISSTIDPITQTTTSPGQQQYQFNNHKTPTSSTIPIAPPFLPNPVDTHSPPLSSRITSVNGNDFYPDPAYDPTPTTAYPPRTSSSLSGRSSQPPLPPPPPQSQSTNSNTNSSYSKAGEGYTTTATSSSNTSRAGEGYRLNDNYNPTTSNNLGGGNGEQTKQTYLNYQDGGGAQGGGGFSHNTLPIRQAPPSGPLPRRPSQAGMTPKTGSSAGAGWGYEEPASGGYR